VTASCGDSISESNLHLGLFLRRLRSVSLRSSPSQYECGSPFPKRHEHLGQLGTTGSLKATTSVSSRWLDSIGE
jgi:hypothetical protein